MDGLGDLRLGFKYFLLHQENFQCAAIAGLSLPTGEVERVSAASYLDHDEAADLDVVVREHTHLRLGTGTFDPFVGIEALARLDEHWMVFGSVQADLPLYENRFDYRTSPSAILTVGPAVLIGDTRLTAALFGELFWIGRDRLDAADIVGPGGRFDGSFGVPNTGRFEASIKPALTWVLADALSLNLQARIPLYTRIREDSRDRDVQLTESMGLSLTISTSF